MRWPLWGLAVLVAMASLAFWLLLAGPDRVLGVDSGHVGVALAASVAWLSFYGISVAPRGGLDDAVSPGEWRAWLGLGFTALITGYLLVKADHIAGVSHVRELGAIGKNIALLTIAWTVISYLLAGRWKDRVLEDERDREIEVKAVGWGQTALVFSVIGIIVTLVLTPPERLLWATPLTIAHMLLFGLLWRCLVENAVAAISYWRDRRP